MIKKLTMTMLYISMVMPSLAQQRIKGNSKLHLTASSRFNNAKLSVYQEWPMRKLIDTLRLKEGQQEFMLPDSFPAVYSLSVRKPYASTTILLEGAAADITFSDAETKVTAGPLEMSLQKHHASLAPLEKEWQALGTQYGKETDMEKKILLEQKIKVIADKVMQERILFVKQNHQNTAGAWMASSYAFAWSPAALKELTPLFQKQAWANATYTQLAAKLGEHNSIQMAGKKAPSFTLPNMKGTAVSLDSILQKNEYVLIDVWASWCTPCRVGNRKLAPVYEKFKKKGIEFVSISVDEHHESWEKAVIADKIPWMQLLSDNAMKGNFAAQYQVKSLPTTFLLNKQGMIIKQQVEITDLEKL